MRKKLTVKLNQADIDRAIRETEKTKTDLKNKVNELVKALTDFGVEVAKVQVRSLGAIYTGELESSITGVFNPSTGVGIIKADAPYAVYVEFGTGVVGSRSPHPKPDGWAYDVNSHGEKGWWYLNDNTGRVQWTQGMRSRPFMYNTVKELEKECGRIAREVFSR